MAYRLTRKVYKQGTSLVVTLPAIWVEAAAVKNGSKVEMTLDGTDLLVRPLKARA